MSDEAIKADFMEIHKGVHDLKHFSFALHGKSRNPVFRGGTTEMRIHVVSPCLSLPVGRTLVRPPRLLRLLQGHPLHAQEDGRAQDPLPRRVLLRQGTDGMNDGLLRSDIIWIAATQMLSFFWVHLRRNMQINVS